MVLFLKGPVCRIVTLSLTSVRAKLQSPQNAWKLQKALSGARVSIYIYIYSLKIKNNNKKDKKHTQFPLSGDCICIRSICIPFPSLLFVMIYWPTVRWGINVLVPSLNLTACFLSPSSIILAVPSWPLCNNLDSLPLVYFASVWIHIYFLLYM